MGIVVLVLSDLHLGHNEVPIDKLEAHLETYFINRITDDVDLVVINGDFYDKLLDMSSKISYRATRIIQCIINACDIHRVLLRVIRGTYSHDLRQLQFFEAERHPLVECIDELKLEYIEELKLHVLYIPDNLTTTNLTKDIAVVLDANHLSKVDIIFNHGYLSHLVPEGISHIADKALDSEFISTKCRVLVNGHIHEYSVYKNLISCGSFERLSHGYEGAKGFIELHYDTDKNIVEHKLIENKEAALFKTFVGNTPGEEGLKQFQKWLNAIEKGTAFAVHIAIHTVDETLKTAYTSLAREKFPEARLKFKWLSKHIIQLTNAASRHVPETPLTKENLVDQMHIRLKEQGDKLSKERIAELME